MAKAVGGLNIPQLEQLGIGNLHSIQGVKPQTHPMGYVTKANEMSVAKDTMTGHWEIMGLLTTKSFKLFTDTGFPDELIEEIKKVTGRGVIGNKAASGTAILDELGEEHIQTGDLIVYTSGDSVLQIAANEAIISPEQLQDICRKVREITMKEEWLVARVIARPFIGEKSGYFTRTSNRHDYALKPFDTTVMDELKQAGFDVIAIGKIYDIFAGEGITQHQYTVSNEDGMNKFIDSINQPFKGLSFLNLVDFDAMYGHRRNAKGYAGALEAFDIQLKQAIQQLKDDDLLIITADHGNDPTHHGTDHTREYIPVIFYSKMFKEPRQLPILTSFASIGATIADNFNVTMPTIGESVLEDLI
jgi:phosphopentomutase